MPSVRGIIKYSIKNHDCMTLYLIGIGIGDFKDITIKGLDAIRNSDEVFLECYTSRINSSIEEMEKFYGKKVFPADRFFVENKEDVLIKKAKTRNVALLIIGDVFAATTHINLFLSARKANVEIKIIHNASVLTAVGETGLDLYKFGRTVSIPFENKEIKSPADFIRENIKNGLHTLILLDMIPLENKFLRISDAVDYLLMNKFSEKTLAVGCAALGTDDREIKSGTLSELSKKRFSKLPQCLIILGKMHFVEEEMFGIWKD